MASYWTGKTVFVTGGLGFVGSHFVQELLDLGANVVCVYRAHRPDRLPESPRLRLLRLDLLDQSELRAAFRYCAPRVDAVVQCAALDGNAEFKATNPARILDSNLRITSNVLNSAREYDIADVVLISSAEIYNGQYDQPIREQDDQHNRIGCSNNGYVISKTFAEILAELHREQFGMQIYLPRPTNVYGPGDNFAGASSRVIPRLLAGIAAGQEIEIWGDGSQSRTFVHVRDVVRTTLRMVETSAFRTFNIGSAESVSILELAQLVGDAVRTRPRIRLVPDKPTGPSSRELDLTLMNKVIDFAPISLRDGLRETADWYLRQKQNG